MKHSVGEINYVDQDLWAAAVIIGAAKEAFLSRFNLVRLQLIGASLIRRPVQDAQRPQIGDRVAILEISDTGRRRDKAVAWCYLEHFQKMTKAKRKAERTLAELAEEAAQKAAKSAAARAASQRPGKKQDKGKKGKKKSKVA